jgi:hypothetical protein
MSLRWESGFAAFGADEVATLWRERVIPSALMVVGAGFDPRAPVAYECIAAECKSPVDLMRLLLPLPTDPATSGLAESAKERINAAASAAKAKIIEFGKLDAEHSTGMKIARSFFEAAEFMAYNEVIVDVSAMPRSVFFPLIRGLIELYDSGEWDGQLHVVACDNPRIDALVTGEGVETPSALPGFSDHSATDAETRIWVPVLGEGEEARLEALDDDIRAAEICPVLPFPAADPRRADNLILEYRALLIETMGVELRNFIHAAESNPFDLYRILSALNADYAATLKPLGEARMVLSAHSSKLLSLGVLLAAFEQGLEVRHAGPSLYTIRDSPSVPALAEHDFIVDLWLTGAPYA